MRLWLGIILALSAVGCASTDEQPKYAKGDYFLMPNADDESAATGAAWTGSAMYPRKQMPRHGRTPDSDWEFYFKHCPMNGHESYFSKTAYDCSGPYY